MSKNTSLRGTATWLLSFFTLLGVLNLFNSMFQLNLNGSSSVTYFRFFNSTLGSLNVEVYFWVSVIITFVLFGTTVLAVYRGLPVDPQMLHRVAKIEENLGVNSNMIENTQIGFFTKLEENSRGNEEAFRKMNLSIEDMKREASENLAKQKTAIEGMEQESKKNVEIIQKHAGELSSLEKKIEQITKEVPMEKPKLTSGTKLERVKSIPPRLATKLGQMQTTKVSELLAADPVSIAHQASELVETVANAQAQAQLLMVPGISEKEAEMLVKFGITSRKELADQDPVQLYKGIIGIAKAYAEQGKISPRKIPKVEDVASWIKQAQL